MSKFSHTVRIISGQWRSRHISFPDIMGLRPTQDRIRETLFNWLAPYIEQAQCLDLFAGSGILGFEALSRGALFVCFVDSHPQAITALKDNALRLGVDPTQFVTLYGRCPDRIPSLPKKSFDIVFLDPPFHQNLLPLTIDWLIQYRYIHEGSFIYIEAEKKFNLLFPPHWQVYRKKTTASLIYQLIQIV